MNRSLNVIALIMAFVLPAVPLAAQDPAVPGEKPVPRDELALRYHQVNGSSNAVQALGHAAERAYGRKILTEDGVRSNIFTVGTSIAVLETRDRIAAIMDALPQMEKACIGAPDQPADENLQTRILRLKYVDANGLRPLLQNYERMVRNPAGGGLSSNISVLADQNTLVVRETAQVLGQIEQLVNELDQASGSDPSPLVYTLEIQILRVAAEAPKGDAAPAADLASNLRRLGPWQHFEVLGTGLLRVSTNPGNASLRMDLGPEHSAQLSLQGLATMSKDNQTLGIQKCQLEIHSSPRPGEAPPNPTLIQTSTQIATGQYTVIGAAGRMPFLLVIKATI